MVAFVQETRFVPQELLALLDLLFFFADVVHHRAELVFPPPDIRLPFLELTERLLPGLELATEGGNPSAQRRLAGLQFVLLHLEDVPVRLLHVHEALFEFQDVFLLQEQLRALPFEFLPLLDVRGLVG